jgi:hypothetical protein
MRDVRGIADDAIRGRVVPGHAIARKTRSHQI